MLPSEVADAREALGLSHVQLAAELAVTEGEARGWQDGSVPIPRRFARQLQWRLAMRQREVEMEASGLPECAWVHEWEGKYATVGVAPESKQLAALESHAGGCPVCQARGAYAETLPPLPEYPADGAARVLQFVGDRIMRLPPWARPAATGATFFLCYTLLKGGFTLLFNPSIDTILALGIALVLSPMLGALCGFIYGGVRALWSRRSRFAA